MPDESQQITPETIAAAEQLIGLQFTDGERALMPERLAMHRAAYEQLRAVPLPNSVPPAISFDPRLPTARSPAVQRSLDLSPLSEPQPAPADLEELAFAPLTQLSQLIRSGQVSSLALTEMYLGRLRRYNPALNCVVTLTEELALTQARRADAELATGRWRGPLHGIPWGAKDLLATKGIPTSWGALPYKDQLPKEDATVVERLEAAGAVLVAKLSLGSLAWGDVWFGGTTKNPWNLEQGASGSSAGSASATAAGLVGFAIGSETWGSIISPATRCGVSGLRPTFGRVSRHGAMALSWSMDKLGPMCRSVEDCALVFDAIYGPDGRDGSVVDAPFSWNSAATLEGLRVGYLQAAFEQQHEGKEQDDEALELLRSLGVKLVPIVLPDYPIKAFSFILEAEAAAAFDELTRSGRDDLLARQGADAWPNIFRQARLISAVEYIQANRIRTLVMAATAEALAGIDVYVAPSDEATNGLLTNLTGHPAVVVPSGFSAQGEPTSISFYGQLYGEAAVLTAAKAFQNASSFHLQHPVL